LITDIIFTMLICLLCPNRAQDKYTFEIEIEIENDRFGFGLVFGFEFGVRFGFEFRLF